MKLPGFLRKTILLSEEPLLHYPSFLERKEAVERYCGSIGASCSFTGEFQVEISEKLYEILIRKQRGCFWIYLREM